MAVALSPWPDETDANAWAAAVARLRAAIAGRAAESDEAASALGAMASARVEREAPTAPQAIRDEATIRFAGYMAGGDYGAVRSETIGPRSVDYTTNHSNAWRSCGAHALLAPWRVHRAGKTRRIGANPPAAEVTLLERAFLEVLAACGVPPALFGDGDGTAQRESFRRFLHATLDPLAKLIAAELSDKLEAAITLNLDGLFAADLAGRARAFQSMTGAGMDPGKAAGLAGLMESDR